MFWIKGASLEKNFFSKNVGIFNKVKEEKSCPGTPPGKHPGNTHEMPMKHPGKVHLLMFWIKGASLEKKNFFS